MFIGFFICSPEKRRKLLIGYLNICVCNMTDMNICLSCAYILSIYTHFFLKYETKGYTGNKLMTNLYLIAGGILQIK